MDDIDKYRVYGRARLDDRMISELIGLCHGALADGVVTDGEAAYIKKWLAANSLVSSNPVIEILMSRIQELEQQAIAKERSSELAKLLMGFVGGDYEMGEMAKSTNLPLDIPYPTIEIPNRRFCFTGTFAFGTRSDCESAVIDRGGLAGGLTQRTNYLIVGSYATSSWIQSSYGRKIESAVELRRVGLPIKIVSEDHWLTAL